MEVNYNGEWGTVCDDGWDDTDAGVVCRQLGFGSSGTAIGSANFSQGSGSIFLSNILCNGGESILSSCGHLGINVTTSCSHINDAGIRCSESKGLIKSLKLKIHLKSLILNLITYMCTIHYIAQQCVSDVLFSKEFIYSDCNISISVSFYISLILYTLQLLRKFMILFSDACACILTKIIYRIAGYF